MTPFMYVFTAAILLNIGIFFIGNDLLRRSLCLINLFGFLYLMDKV